jgi:Tol biopolymer transport system component
MVFGDPPFPQSWQVVHADGSVAARFGTWDHTITIFNQAFLRKTFLPDGPLWSHDGSKVFFVDDVTNPTGVSGTVSTSNIWVVNSDGTASNALSSITAANGHSIQPSLSPDGLKIAFASARALDGSNTANPFVTFNIWIMNADGTVATPLTKLTAAGASSISPVWSPDGSKLAFASARALDGSNASNLNATMNLWVMNADGTGAAPLTNQTAAGIFTENPAWSPDRSKLAFDSTRGLDGSDSVNAAANIWVILADGSGATAITKLSVSEADSFRPQWRP